MISGLGLDTSKQEDDAKIPDVSGNREIDSELVESIEEEDEIKRLQNYHGWTTNDGETSGICKQLGTGKSTLLSNTANSFHRLSRNLSSRNSSKSGKPTQTSKQRHCALAKQLIQESYGTIAFKFDLVSAIFLLLVVLSLVVCPAVSLAKSSIVLTPQQYSRPLFFKHALVIIIHLLSIAVGIAIIIYSTLVPILTSVFPLVKTERLRYSDTLLTRLHSTIGASVAYSCIGQHQCMSKKFS